MLNDVMLHLDHVSSQLHDGLNELHVSHIGVSRSLEFDFVIIVVENEHDYSDGKCWG